MTVLPAPSSPVSFNRYPSLLSPTNTATEGDKSATQKVGDATRSGGDEASGQSKGVLAQAQESIGNAAASVQDTLSGQQKK